MTWLESGWQNHLVSSTGAALAACHQGPASAARNGTFAETDTYVADVLALRHRF